MIHLAQRLEHYNQTTFPSLQQRARKAPTMHRMEEKKSQNFLNPSKRGQIGKPSWAQVPAISNEAEI